MWEEFGWNKMSCKECDQYFPQNLFLSQKTCLHLESLKPVSSFPCSFVLAGPRQRRAFWAELSPFTDMGHVLSPATETNENLVVVKWESYFYMNTTGFKVFSTDDHEWDAEEGARRDETCFKFWKFLKLFSTNHFSNNFFPQWLLGYIYNNWVYWGIIIKYIYPWHSQLCPGKTGNRQRHYWPAWGRFDGGRLLKVGRCWHCQQVRVQGSRRKMQSQKWLLPA